MFTIEGGPLSLTEFKTAYLLRQFPALQPVLSSSLFAINLEYVERDTESTTILSSSCEIAILPPVSGG